MSTLGKREQEQCEVFKLLNYPSIFCEPPTWMSLPVNNRSFGISIEQPDIILRCLLYGTAHSLDVEDSSHLESPGAANKVEDDSDGHETRHFKPGCETQAAASLDLCLSEEGAQKQQANTGVQVGERKRQWGISTKLMYYQTVRGCKLVTRHLCQTFTCNSFFPQNMVSVSLGGVQCQHQ